MKVYNLSAKVATYKDRDGNEKAKWAQIGILRVTDDGKIYGNMELIPTNWDGHFNVFEMKEGGKL